MDKGGFDVLGLFRANFVGGGEIGRQFLKGAPGNRYQSIVDLTHPTHRKPDHNTGNSMPYSLRIVCGFFNVPQYYLRRRLIVLIREDLKVEPFAGVITKAALSRRFF